MNTKVNQIELRCVMFYASINRILIRTENTKNEIKLRTEFLNDSK